jgi:EAL domain-containing protein (putative c-di-GMP-specific phosphodiesterase class I)
MTDDKNMKEQRDRFLAFSFASSDLFLEISEKGEVTYALGAAKGLTGIDDESLTGIYWLDLFSKMDRPTLVAIYSKAKPVQRCGPLLVTLASRFGDRKKAVLTAIKMPDDERFYITLGFTSVLLAKTGEIMRVSEERDLLDKDTFLHAAKEAMNLARGLNQDVDLTLIDFPDIHNFRKRVGKDNWKNFSELIGGFLRARSVDGISAAQIDEGRYSVLHDKEIEADTLREQIAGIARENDPQEQDIEISSKTVTSELKELTEHETTKALVYTINEFQRKGAELTIETLNTGFEAYVSANAQKISQFKSIIQQLAFNMYFHPIVDLNANYEATHFEILSRFLDGGSTLEWVVFAEDIGMAPDFDMAVLERAINYLKYKSSGRRSRFAINVSGQSIQNEQFFEQLREKLKIQEGLSERLIFEITESSRIEDLQKVAKYLNILRGDGFKVCLDDFGAGSASFQYLQALEVDFLKIDGEYTRRILTSERDMAMIRSLVSMCRDLEIKVIAEMIEEEEQIYRLRHLGTDYAQGFIFALPTPKPEYTPPKKFIK